MEFVSSPHGGYYATDCANFLSKPNVDCLRVAITNKKLLLRLGRGQRVQLGQLYGVIGPGAILASSAHRGLNRGMMVGEDDKAHLEKYALILNAKNDAKLVGDVFDPANFERVAAPANTVFCVYLSLNKMTEEYPEIDCWIEHWTWIGTDTEDTLLPVDWKNRYDEACFWKR